jgi:hypothetical protein
MVSGKTYNLVVMNHCGDSEIRSLLYEFKAEHEKQKLEAQRIQDELWENAQEDLVRASNEIKEGDSKSQSYYFTDPACQSPENIHWWDEIYEFWNKLEADRTQTSESQKQLIKDFVSQFEPKSTSWEASLNFEAGKLTAICIPTFTEKNLNNWRFDPRLKTNILQDLNSGAIPLKDAHSTKIRDEIGTVCKAWEDFEGKILVEADVFDEDIDKILKKRSKSIAVSIAGEGTGFCEKCGQLVKIASQHCLEHPEAGVIIKQFKVKEVSLTSSPAFKEAKTLKYEPSREIENE